MQTLGVSNSTPPSENRLKNLFWPTITTATDVDTLGTQGYWICAIVAVLVLASSILAGRPIAGALLCILYFVGGTGVREHSRFAAALVFFMFFIETVFAFGIWKLLLCLVLLSNLRATFIASSLKSSAPESEMPMRFDDTWADKFADKLPALIWPKVRIVYYIFSIGYLILTCWGLFLLMRRGGVHPLR
jgi:hypothetical protein